MDKLYLMIFSEEKYTQAQLTKHFDKAKGINFWFYATPHSIFIKSPHTAQELSAFVERSFGEHTHLIAELSSQAYGRLPKQIWDYINQPNPKPDPNIFSRHLY